ncbi:MAG TPA: MFS transporter [Thermoplasmata archaeon]|nr:MFS transporter [Thermoplasmata archaeon]
MAVPAPAASPEGHRELPTVLVATLFVRFSFGLTVAVFASYLSGRSTGLDLGQVGVVGLVSATAPIGEFTTVVLSGILADAYGRFRVLLGGMLLATVAMALVATTRDPARLGALNLLFGVASGAILAPSLAVVGDRAAAVARGYEMGRFDAMNLLGWVLGFAVGFGLLGSIPNGLLDSVFLLGATVLGGGLAIASLTVGFRSEPTRPTRFVLEQIGQAVLRRDVLLVVLPWVVIYMLIGTAFVFLGAASSSIGLPVVYLAAIIGGGGLVLLATQPFFGRLSDRFGRMRLMGVGAGGFVVLLIVAALLANLGPQPPLLVAAGVSAVFALGYGPAALAALADVSRTITRATTMAVYTLAISLGMLLGLFASTALFNALGVVGLDVFFGGVAAALLALTLARFADVRRRRPEAAMV